MEYNDKIIAAFRNLGKTTETFTEKSGLKDIYDKCTNKVKSLGNYAKLSMKYNNLYEQLQKVYTEIGKIYYREHYNLPESIYEVLFQKVAELNEEISAVKNQFDNLQGFSNSASDNNANFEDTVSTSESED